MSRAAARSLGKVSAIPGFAAHLGRAARVALQRRWRHYTSLRRVTGNAFYIDPTVLLHTDGTGRIVLGRGASIGPYCYVCALDGSSLELGDDVYINEFNNLRAAGGDIVIGSRTMVAEYVSIIGSNHVIPPAGASIRDAGNDGRRAGVSIGRDVWIGANAVILPGVEIGDGCVVGAGAVVTRSVPAQTVIAGNPARALRHR